MCNAIYDEDDKKAQPNGCHSERSFCNRPADHMVHLPVYWGKFIPSHGCFGHRYVAPKED